jgi:DNA-binding transcriptional LysR family regulator
MVRITLDGLAVLDAVDRLGSFAAAAASLNRVPAAVSYSVQKLEQDLGISLFDRRRHRATPTPAGRRLVAEGRVLLDSARRIERTVRRVADGWESTFSIAVGELVEGAAIYSLVRAFYEHDAETITHLSLGTASGSPWCRPLLAGEVDLLVGVPADEPPERGISMMRLGAVNMALAVPSGHPFAQPGWQGTDREVGLFANRGVVTRAQARKPNFAPKYRVSSVLVVESFATAAAAISAGLGIGYVPRYILDGEVERKRLAVADAVAVAPLPIAVAWRDGDHGKALAWFLARLNEPSARVGFIPTFAATANVREGGTPLTATAPSATGARL